MKISEFRVIVESSVEDMKNKIFKRFIQNKFKHVLLLNPII